MVGTISCILCSRAGTQTQAVRFQSPPPSTAPHCLSPLTTGAICSAGGSVLPDQNAEVLLCACECVPVCTNVCVYSICCTEHFCRSQTEWKKGWFSIFSLFGGGKFSFRFLVKKVICATFLQSPWALALCQARSVWVGAGSAWLPAGHGEACIPPAQLGFHGADRLVETFVHTKQRAPLLCRLQSRMLLFIYFFSSRGHGNRQGEAMCVSSAILIASKTHPCGPF